MRKIIMRCLYCGKKAKFYPWQMPDEYWARPADWDFICVKCAEVNEIVSHDCRCDDRKDVSTL